MEGSSVVEECLNPLQIDESYEFSAPRYFDFVAGETQDEIRQAQKWFEVSRSYGPSPFMLRIKTRRSVDINSNCNFQETEQFQPAQAATEIIEENMLNTDFGVPEQEAAELKAQNQDNLKVDAPETSSCPDVDLQNVDSSLTDNYLDTKKLIAETCMMTPKERIIYKSRQPENSCKNTSGGKSLQQRPSSKTKSVKQTPILQAKGTKGSALRVPASVLKNSTTVDIKQENQAIKRQKLEGGKPRQILNVKERILHHKSQVGVISEKPTNALTGKSCREKRYELTTRKEINPNPFVSAAELIKKFQSRTRELDISQNRSLSHDAAASLITHRKPTLTLTHPKEPEFQTARRVRPVKVKSSAKLEEEILANIPKFKARPLNKKILDGPTLPPLPRSIPQPTQFLEFRLQTMERASQHSRSSSLETLQREKPKSEHAAYHGLTIPKSPHLETSSRARPPTVKSSQELEQEELSKIPKFKARPLNKKIFHSKGELGLFCNQKHQITVPEEFHFATDDRIPPPAQPVADLFDMLSINSENHEKQLTRVTLPNPFHLATEERGLEKEKRLAEGTLHQQLEEQKARIPKAIPYPYSTDYPVIPTKPQSKECTKPEGFQLDSLIRHEEEMKRMMEDRERAEKEAARMRIFKAQLIMSSDPMPVPERTRKPLTQVQELVLHVERRAVDRVEFDKKVKEKEDMVKRHREESESALREEEEKETKQMRRMMVPHARPLPNFVNPFVPGRSSKELTKPKSPCLLVAQRKLRLKSCITTGTYMR